LAWPRSSRWAPESAGGGRALAAERWERLVVLLAANSYDEPKVADRHLAETLSEYVPVLYVDPPISKLTPLRRPELRASAASPGLTYLSPQLARVTPIVQPGMLRSGLASVTAALTRRVCARTVRSIGVPVAALISTSPVLPVFGSCLEQLSVYWAQDDFAAGAELMGISRRLINKREPRIAAAADMLITSSPVVQTAWQARGLDPEFIPYGCDVESFAETGAVGPPPDASLPTPVVGMVGRLNDRLNLAILEEVAARGLSLLIVGPRDLNYCRDRVDRLLALANVQWVGPKDFTELPAYLGAIEVGIVPYQDSAFNRASFPLKTLEYLSAGLPVVATDLPSTRWLNLKEVTLVDQPSGFADAVEAAFEHAHDPERVRQRQDAAAQHSWRKRAQDFAVLLGLA